MGVFFNFFFLSLGFSIFFLTDIILYIQFKVEKDTSAFCRRKE